jgi:hypothetical protein
MKSALHDSIVLLCLPIRFEVAVYLISLISYRKLFGGLYQTCYQSVYSVQTD